MPENTGFYERAVDLINNRVSSETDSNRSLSVGLHTNWASGRSWPLRFPKLIATSLAWIIARVLFDSSVWLVGKWR